MNVSKCPGQDWRYWKADDISEQACPACGQTVELWKDDASRRCGRCGATVRNRRFDMGCAAGCKFAEECTGIPAEELAERTLCDALIREMEAVFGDDERRIRHALRVLDYAERILADEQADPLVVKAAAVLHDIGIHEAERKHGSAAGVHQQVEGPPIARRILEAAGVSPERIDHVCRIIADHHTAERMDTPEFRILCDADNLVNHYADAPPPPGEATNARIERQLRTQAGRAVARELVATGRTKDARGGSDSPASSGG